MSETMELTQVEKEMITLKREQELLAKKEAELKRQARLEKDIADVRNEMEKLKKSDLEQIAAAKEFHNKLGAGFDLKIHSRVDTKHVKQYNEQNEYVSVWSDNVTRKEAVIIYGEYVIRVEPHVTYGKGTWGRATNHGYKMFVKGPGIDYCSERKALTNVTTVKKKIETAIDTIQAEKDRKEKQTNAVTVTVEKMQGLYPNAIVSSFRDSEKHYKGHYESYDAVQIIFENGIKIKYKVYSDGSLGRKDITFNVKNNWTLMEMMNGLTITESQKVSK